MKLTVPTQELSDAMRKVLSVVSARSTLPVLSNVLLVAREGRLTLTTTDLEVSISTTVEAEIEREGETTLPAKYFGRIVATLKAGNVTIDTAENYTTKVTCGNAVFNVMGMDSAEFPLENEFQEDRKLTFPTLEFNKTLRKIAYAVSTDTTRYVLNGILLSIREGNFTVVATDGRRLALVERILDDAESVLDGDVILPIKVVNELQRVLDDDGELLIKLSDSRASFSVGNTLIISKLVEGTYPNYRQVIPASFKNSLILGRETFGEVLNRVAVVVTESGASVRFELEQDGLTLSASSSEGGEGHENLEVSYQGDPVKISFNPQFLRDPLKNLECDELTLRFNDEFKPVVLLGDEGFLYVIMPMRN